MAAIPNENLVSQSYSLLPFLPKDGVGTSIIQLKCVKITNIPKISIWAVDGKLKANLEWPYDSG